MGKKKNVLREVSLQEILWEILLGWKKVCVSAIIFGILACAIRYIMDLNLYNASNQQSETKNVQSAEMTDDEKEEVDNVMTLKASLDEIDEYLNESILMNIDPYAENVLIMQYYIDSEYVFDYKSENNIDYTQSIVAAYGDYIKCGQLAEKIINNLELKVEPRYIEEVLSVETNYQNQILTIEMIYNDDSSFETVESVVQEELNAQTEQLRQSIGEHSLVLLSQNSAVKVDSELVSQQKAVLDRRVSIRNQINSEMAAMSDAQVKLLDGEGDENTNQEVVAEKHVKPVLNVKYMILGLVAGTILAIIWIVWDLLSTDKIQRVDELEQYNFPVLWEVRRNNQKGINHILWNIKNGRKKQLTDEQNVEMICYSLKKMCEKKQINQILLCGTEPCIVENTIIRSSVSQLKQEKIEVLLVKDGIYDIKTIKALDSVHKVILVEQIGVSKLSSVGEVINLISNHESDILGCLLL